MSFDTTIKLMKNTYTVHVYGTQANSISSFSNLSKKGKLGNYFVAVTQRQLTKGDIPFGSFKSTDGTFQNVLLKDKAAIMDVVAELYEHMQALKKIYQNNFDNGPAGEIVAHDAALQIKQDADLSSIMNLAIQNNRMNYTIYFPETETVEMRRTNIRNQRVRDDII